jgi:hypothetical protein
MAMCVFNLDFEKKILMIQVTDQEKEVFDFLLNLRDSGVTNMFGARPYIQDAFPNIDEKQAGEMLVKWMENFDKLYPDEG